MSTYSYRSFESSNKFKYIIDSNSNDTLEISTIEVGRGRLAESQNTAITKVEIDNDTFYVDNNRGWWRGNRWMKSELTSIRYNCRIQTFNSSITGSFSCSKRIEKNKISLHLSPDGNLTNKIMFYENNKDKVFCDFEIKNDSIFIQNPPYEFLSKGKINRRKNKIRFKDNVNRKHYYFRLKTRRINNWISNTRFY